MTLSPEFVTDAFKRWEEQAASHKMTAVHHLQTNLLRYDSNWRKVIETCFQGKVSSSFDYPNLHRRSLDEEGYTRRFMRNFRRLKDDGFRCGIIAIPNQKTLELGPQRFLEFYFNKLQTHGVQVNLPFPSPSWTGTYQLPVDYTSPLLKFLTELYTLWRNSYRGLGFDLEPLASMEARLTGDTRRSRLPCLFGRNCADQFVAIGPDLTVAQCDCWVLSDPDFAFGNLKVQSLIEIMRSSEVRQQLLERPARLLEGTCGTCEHLGHCFGGCPVRSRGFYGSPLTADPYCELYKGLYDSILTLRRGEAS